MKSGFLEVVKERTILFDGAMGTMLIQAGIRGEECPEIWNVTHSEDIQKIHKSYFEAGADVVLTNTFGGNEIKLGAKGLQDRVKELNLAAVQNAQSVCPKNGYVGGDIGPTGKYLPPVGKITENEWFHAFTNQATALLEGGVDLIVIETMQDIREAIQALRAVREIDSSIPVITTMTFDKKKRGFFTIMGDPPEKCFTLLKEKGANVVGANCSIQSSDMIELCKLVRDRVELPMSFQPNAGKPELVNGKTLYSQTPSEFASDIMALVNVGANIVGGCCGTNPDFIQQTQNALKSRL